MAGGVLGVEPYIDFSTTVGTAGPYTQILPAVTANEIQLLDRVSKLEKEIDELKKANGPHVIVLQEISREEAKQRVIELLDSLKGERIYPDEIADKLGIEFSMVMDILDELEKEEEIEIVDSG